MHDHDHSDLSESLNDAVTDIESVDFDAPVREKKPRHKVTAENSFLACGVPDPLVSEMSRMGIKKPFPIQAATLPDSMAGRDILGRGRTGSGKTLAFALPVVTRLVGGKTKANRPRAIILAPTRELAQQINETIEPLADTFGLRTLTIYGGVSAVPQINALRRGVDIVVACPGRLLDHYRSGKLMFDDVEITVIDEADHMADLGFLPDVTAILDATPASSQRLLFSATLDRDVNVLVRKFLHDPATHSVDSDKAEASSEMTHRVLHVDSHDRLAIMADLAAAPGKTIIFTRTRHGAEKLTVQLGKLGVAAVDLHGTLSQAARARNLEAFTSGRATTLVCTDVAARGIHVDDIALVIHADPPAEHKAYLHRSGRTARAGNSGTVVTMMTGAQTRAVRTLTAKAGISPITSRIKPGDPILMTIKPGERTVTSVKPDPNPPKAERGNGGGSRGKNYKGSRAGTARVRTDDNRSSKGDYDRPKRERDSRPEYAQRAERNDRTDRRDRPARSDDRATATRTDRPTRTDRTDRPTRADRDQRSGRPARVDRPGRPEYRSSGKPRKPAGSVGNPSGGRSQRRNPAS